MVDSSESSDEFEKVGNSEGMLENLGKARGTVMHKSGTIMEKKKSSQKNIFEKQDTIVSKESIFVKGDTLMDRGNNFFPDDKDEDDSDNSESMIGGLGSGASAIMKEPSSVFSHQRDSRLFLDSENGSTGSVTLEKEERKISSAESQEDDAEILKGEEEDFSDNEEDLSIRFSKQILSEDK